MKLMNWSAPLYSKLSPIFTDLFPLFLGYKKIAESSKPTAASFSFGKRHTHISRDDTVGPGPAEYDVSGLGSKGIYCD